jgi:hypothetical protein
MSYQWETYATTTTPEGRVQQQRDVPIDADLVEAAATVSSRMDLLNQ